MDSVIDLANPPLFDRDKWIGKGVTYSLKDLPYFVIDACADAFTIPSQERSRFPANDITVAELMKKTFLSRSSAFITTKPQTWFSNDLPASNLDFLADRAIPNKDFLKKLKRLASQAWLDGAQSLVDPRYNDGVNRLPLWGLSYWIEMSEIADAKESWAKCERWLSVASNTPRQSEAASQAFANASAFLPGLGWRAAVQGLDNQQTTLEFTKLLGEDWLSSGLIQMMIDHLSARVNADPTLAASTIIGGPSLAQSMVAADVQKLAYSRKSTALLSRYEEHIKSSKTNHLYFPANVNGNHWIAVHVDFEKREFSYGDSLASPLNKPTKVIRAVKRWLNSQFKGRWKEMGNILHIGKQHDSNSCGICVINAIARAILKDKLWTQSRAKEERALWFSILAKMHNEQSVSTAGDEFDGSLDTELLNEPEVSLAVAIGDHNFSDLREFALSSDSGATMAHAASMVEHPSSGPSAFAIENLLNPVTHDDDDEATNLPTLIPDHDDTKSMQSVSFEADVSSMDATSADIMSINAPSSVDIVSMGPTGSSDGLSIPSDTLSTEPMSIGAQSDNSLEDTYKPKSGVAKPGFLRWIDGIGTNKKRKKIDIESSSLSSSEVKEKKSLKQSARAGFKSVIGQSKSAAAERKQRELVKEGTYVLKPKLFDKWKNEILQLDPGAEVDEKAASWVRHSNCGEVRKLKGPLDRTRFRAHLKECRYKDKPSAVGRTPTVSQWASTFNTTLVTPSQRPEVKRPCPGLQHTDDSRITTYLERSGASGGGARSVTAISKERFKKMFRKLSSRRKEEVVDAQIHEYRWKNDHKRTRIYSTACAQDVFTLSEAERALPCSKCAELLRDNRFKQALMVPRPDDENCAFINERWRPPQKVAELYGRIHGLREIFETADAKDTPCVKFAQGVLAGKYDDLKVFTGLVEAMVSKVDREDRGVGMQNFSYPPAYDEFIHVVNIHSPRAHRFLAQHLPARTQRSYRTKEAREPRMPMQICDRSFELVDAHLSALGYSGPVGLSCDDTKLFPDWRLYWDAKEKSHFLVGGTDGPMRVADPDNLRKMIDDLDLKKATKVRLWCLQVPLPKVAPIIVAALPISDTMGAEQLFELAKKVIYGLLDRHIKVVSYACDGTEVERALQRLLLAHADSVITHTIKNPRPGCPDTVIKIGVFRGQPIVMIQDSKHGLKTFRNNLFSGARLLTLGNYTAIYRHIEQLAYEAGTPLYHRDVHKLDRQDDNAAARLFSAATLEFLSKHHPEYLGEVVYLFIFGELIDAYQNREIDHEERVQMALRARYFLDDWQSYLKGIGSSEKQYFISREATDIARQLIDGIIGLIIVHRDHLKGEYPLLLWLHSSEACEHVFGEARQIVKDFTMLDFFYMLTKLRIKLREAVLSAHSPNFKARANGYCHTYLDTTGINTSKLAAFPSNGVFQAAAERAMEQCESVIALLGVQPAALWQALSAGQQFPAIASWYTEDTSEMGDELESDEELEPETDDALELQRIMEHCDSKTTFFSQAQELEITRLSCAAMALLNDDMAAVQQLPEDDADEDAADESFAEECQQIMAAMPRRPDQLPEIQTSDSLSRPFGQGTIDTGALDLSALVTLRFKHQTRHAALAVRTRYEVVENLDADAEQRKQENSLKRELIKRFNEILKEQQGQGSSTGQERLARWRTGEPEAATGNVANAAAAATKAAKSALTRRRDIFKTAGISCLTAIGDARINSLRGLQIGDHCLVYLNSVIKVGEVIALYSKGGGKNGKHAAVPDVSNVGAVSYTGMQIFEQMHRQAFRSITSETARFSTNFFQLLPPQNVLTRLVPAMTKLRHGALEICTEDLKLFSTLSKEVVQVESAMKLFRKRLRKKAKTGDSGAAHPSDDED
ncbi:hypothetical protein HWV62_17764 [Athelia sp. TMB]|nr:hypothetical protein HWV62_17764 [Athelia sp. TMB]